MSLTVSLALFLSCLAVVGCTSDLNFLKLQMVADHLSDHECHELFEALHMQHFFLEHSLSGTELPGKYILHFGKVAIALLVMIIIDEKNNGITLLSI